MAEGSWLALLSFGMQVACAFRDMFWPILSPFDPVEHPRQPSQWRVRQPTERDVIPSVFSCRVLLDVAEGVA